ncbi:MAG: BLUF domain-containing protein [Stagnimonas sp.]|nr:BLUF domain-containing protein [Stagnimonas sp.]
MLQKLIYASQAIKPVDTGSLQAILETARIRNEKDGVTGFLLYADESFLQILEGEEDVLTATYGRIAADPRHSGLRLLQRVPISKRRFGSWTMGFDLPDTKALGSLPGYQPSKRYPLVSPDLVRNGTVAELMLGRYALAA